MHRMAGGHVFVHVSAWELISMFVYKKLVYVICVALTSGLPPFFPDIKAHLCNIL